MQRHLTPASLAFPHDAAWSLFILQERLGGRWPGQVTLFGGGAKAATPARSTDAEPVWAELPIDTLKREILEELVGDDTAGDGPVTALWAAETILAQPNVIWEGPSPLGYYLTVYDCPVRNGDFPWLAQRLLKGVPNGKAIVAEATQIARPSALKLVQPMEQVFDDIFTRRYGIAA